LAPAGSSLDRNVPTRYSAADFNRGTGDSTAIEARERFEGSRKHNVAINYLQRTRQQCVPTQSLNLLEAATGRDYLILRLLLSAVLRPSELCIAR